MIVKENREQCKKIVSGHSKGSDNESYDSDNYSWVFYFFLHPLSPFHSLSLFPDLDGKI